LYEPDRVCPAAPGGRHAQVLGRLASGGSLSGVPLCVTQDGDGLHERGEARDQGDRGEARIAVRRSGGKQPGCSAQAVPGPNIGQSGRIQRRLELEPICWVEAHCSGRMSDQRIQSDCDVTGVEAVEPDAVDETGDETLVTIAIRFAASRSSA
jgi:hypothetical protein